MNSDTSFAFKDVSLNGERVTLRTLHPEDTSEEHASWLNDPIINRYLETRSTTLPELREYIAKKFESADALLLGIFWKETGEHIGNIKLEPIDLKEKTAMLGLLIGAKKYWGQGIGTESTALVTNFAFQNLELGEIRLGVIADNKPAIRVYEKCGFVIDHIEKDGINHDGVLHDKVHMIKKAQ
ncbi:MAG: hypothetical protein A2854_00780 [Parcubacteria group bacterium RIFCSPHIGHO2_01_FULL_56_18]|nr:MAG: hypothetical protein A2854_00780 [Parcubacteria group bacterium RIFCSPHIGHO2_01_FULL_56_18]